MGDRNSETAGLSVEFWSVGSDVDLPLDTQAEKGNVGVSSIEIDSNSFNSVNTVCNTSNATSKVMPYLPIDVYGKVSIYEGKLILQLKHFNVQTNDSMAVNECWLCKEKIIEGSNLPLHKHVLQGLFHANNEYVQLDIDHYIIPDHALENDLLEVKKERDSKNFHKMNMSHMYQQVQCSTEGTVIFRDSIPDQETINDVAMTTQGHKTNHRHFNSFEDTKEGIVVQQSENTTNNINSIEPSVNTQIDANCFINSFLKNDDRRAVLPSTQNNGNIASDISSIVPKSTMYHSSCSDTYITPNVFSSNDNQHPQTNIQENHMCPPTSAYQNMDFKNQVDYVENGCANILYYQFNEPNKCHAVNPSNELHDVHQTSVGVLEPAQYGTRKRKDKDKVRRKYTQSSVAVDPRSNLISISTKHKRNYVCSKKESVPDENQFVKECPPNERELSLINPIDVSLAPTVIDKRSDLTFNKNKKVINIICPLCHWEFNRRKISLFEIHLKKHNCDNIQFQCPDCNMTISDPVQCIDHLRHRRCERFFCSLCSAHYSRKTKLRRHVNVVHNGKKPFVCDVCPKSFSRSTYLKIHRDSHANKKIECDICHKLFSSQFNLNLHKKLHSGEKLPFACELCERSFVRKDFLTSHVSKDHHMKRFYCDICFKTFSRADVLQRHKNLHNSKTNFVCLECGKSFSRKDSLKCHNCKKSLQKMQNDLNPSLESVSANEFIKESNESKQDIGQTKEFVKRPENVDDATDQSVQTDQATLSKEQKSSVGKPIDNYTSSNTSSSGQNEKLDDKNVKKKLINESKKYSCDICSKTFVKNYSLKVHQMTHEKKGAEDEKLLAELPTVLRTSRVNWTNMQINKFEESNAISESNFVSPYNEKSSSCATNTNCSELQSSSLPLISSLSDVKKSSKSTSDVSLSAHAITAAAYLLSNPFYEGSH